MRWVLIIAALGVGLPVLLFAGAMLYYTLIGNERVIEELKRNPDGARADIVMLLTFPDGRVLPVNYLREGDRVYAGADGRWWRTFRDGDVPVTVFIKGEEYPGRARTVLDDPDYTREVFKRLRPRAPAWLPNWLNGRLVVIDLDRGGGSPG